MEKEPQYSKEENKQLFAALNYLEKVKLKTFSIGELHNMLAELDERDKRNEEILNDYLRNGKVIDFCRDSIVDLLDEYGMGDNE